MNQQIVIGHVGSDVETTTFENGDEIGRISIADGEGYYDRSNEWVDKSSWHYVLVGRKLLPRVRHMLLKGNKLLVIGKVQRRKYTTNDGVEKDHVEIVADKIEQIVTSR